MPRRQLIYGMSCKLMTVADAIRELERWETATHVKMEVRRYVDVPPKPKPELEQGVPGRVHTTDAQDGKVRRV